MQCVILAAGRGTRMMPLTKDTPKPLIKVCGKPILQHIIEALPSEIDEIVVVVGYWHEHIRNFLGTEFLGRRIQYVMQENPTGGTGDALRCARALLHDRFLLMYADDIHGAAALAAVVTHPYAILGTVAPDPQNFGVLVQNEDGTLKEILERPDNPPSNLINIGGMILGVDIFNIKVPVSPVLGELLVTDLVTVYAAIHPLDIVVQPRWIPVGRPADIAKAEAILCPLFIE